MDRLHERGSAAVMVVGALAISGLAGFGIYRVARTHFQEARAEQAARALAAPPVSKVPEPAVTARPEAVPEIGDPLVAPPDADEVTTLSDDGEIDRATLDRIMATRSGSLQRCYEQQLALTPDIGAVDLRAVFVIETSGRPSGITVTGGDRILTACVAGVIRRTEFPKPNAPSKADFPIKLE